MVDEVFRRFEVQTGSAAVKGCPADYEIRIGGRLVAVLTSEPVEPGVRPVGAGARFLAHGPLKPIHVAGLFRAAF